MLTTLLLASTLLAAPQNAPAPAQNAPAAAKPDDKESQRGITERIIEAGPMARSLAADLSPLFVGRVRAAAVGDKLVVTGEVEEVNRAVEMIGQLLQEAERGAMRDRMRADEMRKRKLDEESMNPWMRRFTMTLGPTVGATMDALRQAVDKQVNVVYAAPSLAAIPVPAAELSNVDLRSLVDTLGGLLASSSRPDVSVRFIDSGNPMGGGLPVILVTGDAPDAPRAQVQEEPELAVFRTLPIERGLVENIQQQLRGRQDDQLAAIDAGLELIGRSKDFKIRLHRETGMVFVYGTPKELQLVAQVLGAAPPGLTAHSPVGSEEIASVSVLRDVPLKGARYEGQPAQAPSATKPAPARMGRPAPAPAAPPAEPAPAPSPGGAPEGE